MLSFNFRRLDLAHTLKMLAIFLFSILLLTWFFALRLHINVNRALKIKPTIKRETVAANQEKPSTTKVSQTSSTLSSQTTKTVASAVASGQRGKLVSGATPLGDDIPRVFQDLIKGKGLFGKPPEPPPPQLQGILGNSALISGQWIKVGETSGNITVKEIGANRAVIEVNGERRELQIWSKLPGS